MRNKFYKCYKYLLGVKNGGAFVCQDRECANGQNLERLKNSRHQECKKKLKVRGEGECIIYRFAQD